MRHLVRVLVAVTSSLAALSFSTVMRAGATLSAAGSAAADAAFVQRLLFKTPLAQFSAIARSRVGPDGVAGNGWFDWSTDLCSAPLVGNSGITYNFTEPCRRHDFGYRNTKLLDRRYGLGRYWNRADRAQIDIQFYADMRGTCAHRRLLDRPFCYAWAAAYFVAVRTFGGP